ncbi:alanine racemase [Halothermothrix orenii]|uniref:Alanine racemase n=1 Tax=Halothermothrix orenii (strain H 168 / OCM 544 / DSM 9562) TaxID=373903 RepID=ALR_HALOH|nr:alanine racemase [Halothermothrix orenii]B8D0W1.1 RecName: Full=Alanine racemase [Halothermothrix orenii H 168]ACL68930.1 alanine racemase [Halothermothrix orenii H 168]
MNKRITRPTWAEIDLSCLQFNFNQVKEILGSNVKIMSVVKADAYGHGVIPVAKTLVEAGTQRLAVAIPEEGVELREAGLSVPIQVLGEVLPSQYELLFKYDLIPTVGREETALSLNRLAAKYNVVKKVHIKVDTGMGRIGVRPREAVGFVKKVNSLSNIKIEGLMTHFASADERDKSYTYEQWDKFKQVLDGLNKLRIDIPIKHSSNSAAIIDFKKFGLDMVRPGIMLYGLKPSRDLINNIDLKPVLTWKTRIVYLKEVPPGTGISYGTTYVTNRKSKIATLPVGYADGYPRILSNQGQVLVRGRKAPIRGRVCMDQIMIDVTEIPDVRVGDEVVLIGEQGTQKISATDIAEKADTINYEIVCGISQRVPREYKNKIGG